MFVTKHTEDSGKRSGSLRHRIRRAHSPALTIELAGFDIECYNPYLSYQQKKLESARGTASVLQFIWNVQS